MRQLISAVVAAVLVLGTSGCSDDPEPQFTAPTSDPPSPSPTTEPVVDPPTSTPTAAPEPEPETAKAFIRRWHRVSDAMQSTGVTDTYLALGPDCKTCVETAELINGYYEAGGFIRYSGTTLREITQVGSVNGIVEYDVALSSPPSEYKVRSGAPLQKFPGGENSIRMRLKRTGDSWTVVDYSVLAS